MTLTRFRSDLLTVQQIYDSFWKNDIEVSPGVLDKQKVMNELADYRLFLENASAVYMAVTGGKISKVNTHSHSVIQVHEDYVQSLIDEAVKEALEGCNCQD